jgi:hypothetical protein
MFKLKAVVLLFCLLALAGQTNDAQKKGLVMMDKEKLAQRVELVSKELAAVTRADRTTIEQIETPFFRRGAIYRVVHLGEFRPMAFTVGIAEPDFTTLLPLNPKGFAELAGKAEFRLPDSSKEQLRYVVTFLETTRSFSENFRILQKFDDIELIPNPTDEEKQAYESLKAKYASAIQPPNFTGDVQVTAFAVKRRNLVKINARFSADGNIETTETILEENIPIAFTR